MEDRSLLAAGLDLANECDMPCSITGLFSAEPLSSLLLVAMPPHAPLTCVEVHCHVVSAHRQVLVGWWSLQFGQQHSWEGASWLGGSWWCFPGVHRRSRT